MLTPLPGSEDHKVLWQRGVWIDPDLNKYDLRRTIPLCPTRTGMVPIEGLAKALQAGSPAHDPAACSGQPAPPPDFGFVRKSAAYASSSSSAFASLRSGVSKPSVNQP
jgi:hypothetical protein